MGSKRIRGYKQEPKKRRQRAAIQASVTKRQLEQHQEFIMGLIPRVKK